MRKEKKIMSDYKAVKFDLNKPIKVILAFDEPLTSQSKKYNFKI